MILRSKFTLGRNYWFRPNVWALKKAKDCDLKLHILLFYYRFALFLSLHKRLDSLLQFYTHKSLTKKNVYILLSVNIDLRSKRSAFVLFTILLLIYLMNEWTNGLRFVFSYRIWFFLSAVFKGKLNYQDIHFHQIKV